MNQTFTAETVRGGESQATATFLPPAVEASRESAANSVSQTGGALTSRRYRVGMISQSDSEPQCFHCGTRCGGAVFNRGEKDFCCQGCLTVFELLTENGLADFYNLDAAAGVRIKGTARNEQFTFLDEPAVRERLVDFSDQRITRITLRLPAIHCIACVWLLENLFRLKPGIGQSQVNFPRKEAALSFDTATVKLSQVVALLASLGYEPDLKLSDLSGSRRTPATRRLWMQLGVAGFAFGNLMLLAIGVYFGVDAFSGPMFRKLAGYLGLLLAIPVVLYSALYYWRTAWTSLKQKRLAIEVPIAVGIVAIFPQSAYEVLSGIGEGYFDSLCGLIFFLLCGRLFQQKTFDRLNFERDYESFFPLAVTRKKTGSSRREEAPFNFGFRISDFGFQNQSITSAGTVDLQEEHVSLSQLQVGDVLVIRNGELIPADARVLSGAACIDYSFVTGESEPVEKNIGEHLYAGGRQIGGAIEVEVAKRVSQSYLTSLWNQEAFRKDKSATFETLINAYSRRFTLAVIAIAFGAAVFWAFRDPSKALKAFTSVLIVACPCALALAAPFTLGTAIRALGRRNVFVKSTEIVEAMAKVDAVVFDKTGTLTAAGAQSVSFEGAELSRAEQRWIGSLARYSTHPLSVRVSEILAVDFAEPVRSFVEMPGCGIEGVVDGREISMGSAAWLESRGVRGADGARLCEPQQSLLAVTVEDVDVPDSAPLPRPTEPRSVSPAASPQSAVSQVSNRRSARTPSELANTETSADWKSAIPQTESIRYGGGSVVHVAVDGVYRGCFVLESGLRSQVNEVIRRLSADYELTLLSGDNERQRQTFAALFGERTQFNQSPLNKLEFVHGLERAGKRVMMVGDGLNDAGALKQSDVGVTVVENVSAFSPASDVIMSASMVSQLDSVLRFSKRAARIVRVSFLLSSFYNVIGVSIAASGMLAPIVCAILMPISSISIVAFASGATAWAARRSFRDRAKLGALTATDGESIPAR